MSLTKRYLLDEPKTGFVSANIEKYVCANCFINKGIKEFIKDNGSNNICNYCKTKTIILDLKEVANHIYECISREWYHGDTLREEEIRDEGDYVFYPVGNGESIMYVLEYSDLKFKNEDLLNDIHSYFEDDWYHKSDYLYSSYKDSNSPLVHWKQFKKLVLKKRRFFFQNYSQEMNHVGDNYNPSFILENINKWIDEFDLISTLPKGKMFYRARVFSEKSDKNLSKHEFEAPKSEHLKTSSRMTPDGIPIFYLSFDLKTAGKEIFKDANKYLAIGNLKLSKDIKVVNLTKVHNLVIPDFFYKESDLNRRNAIIFLRSFAEDISKEISKNSFKQIKYIPSQVISEYIKSTRKEHGIIYKSMKTNGKNIALFTDGHEDCTEFLQAKFIPVELSFTE